MRTPEPRIQNASSHHRRYCSLTVAAEYLCVGRRAVVALIEDGKLETLTIGKRRKVVVSSIAILESTQNS